MTDTNNEWKYKAFDEFMSEKNAQDFDKAIDPKTQTEFMLRYFIEAIDNNIPKLTEVVAPIDIEDIIERIGYIKRYSDTRYFNWEEVKKELKKLIIDNLPQSISREAVEKLINRYKRLEECEKDNIWGCALRCFIKDLNSLLPNKSNDSD